MAFDIEAKIRQLQSQLEKKTNELQSFNSANYFGHEAKEVRRLNREIAVLKEELNKWETTKKMNKNLKDSLDILKLSGLTVDSEEQGITTEKKPSSYYTHRAAAQNRLLNDIDEIKYEYKKGGKKLSHGKLLQELGNYGWEDYELEGLKLPLSLDACSNKDGYKMEDPKEIEAAIKKVKASSHPNPQYLAALERALKIAKQERGMKDACPTKDGDFGFRSIVERKDSLKQAERELQKAEADRNKHRGERYWEENYIAAKKDVERARENLARAERNHSRSNRDDCGEKIFTKGKENEMAKDDDATKGGAIKEYGDKNSETMEDACSTKDSYVTWVKPSGVEYKIGDVIQFKGKEVKITKITGNVVEATVLGEAKDGCSSKDADPRVADAEAMIKLCGGVM